MIRYIYILFNEKGKLFIPFLSVVVLLTVIGAFTVKTVKELSGDYELITERYTINQGLEKILAKSVLGQSELRAFYLTGDTNYLYEYRANVDTIQHLFFSVDSVITPSHQQQLLDSLRLALQERMQFNEAKLRLYLKEGNIAAQKKYLTQYGQSLIRSIDSLIVMMQNREEQALALHYEQMVQRTKLTLALILFGGLTSVVVLVVIFVKLNGEIRQRMKAEQTIRESEQRLFNFLEAVPAGVYILTADGKPYYANEAAKKILGRDIVAAATPDKLHEIYSAYQQGTNDIYPAEENPIIRALKGERRAISDIEIRRPDAVVPLFVTGAPIYDSNGALKFAMAAFIDITLQKNAELKLAESEERYRQIIEYATDIIYRTDRNGNLTYVNPVGLKMFGFTGEEALGMNYVDLVRAEEKETIRRFYLRQAASKTPHTYYEFSALTKEGISIILGQNVRLLTNGNRVEGFLAVARDITEKKHAEIALHAAKEEAESATRAKSLFLATMSHEIRTPMNGVIGMTDLLLQTELTNEQHEYAEIIRTSGETLLTLINDILDFSKIESGRLELEERPVDVQHLIEETFDLVAYRAVEKNLDLLYMIEPSVPPFIIGDPVRLRQILLNLSTNAIKFTEQGEVYISVRNTGAKNNSVTLEFSVHDTGIGIPQDKIEKLFTAFTQVDASTTRKFGGTGLGLAITKRLVELMNGRVWVESNESSGSTFFFTIVAATADPSALPPTKYVQGRVPELQGKRILLVDDNKTNLNILSIQCSMWGMYPRATTSQHEALGWLKKGDPFDIAILDYHMPEMNGVDLARQIRSVRSDSTMPLILFSSSGHSESSIEKEDLFAAVVVKPIKQTHLHDALLNVFASSGKKRFGKSSASVEVHAPMSAGNPLTILVAEDNVVNQKLALRLLQQIGYTPDIVSNGKEALTMVRQKQYDIVFMDLHMPEMDGLDATREIVRTMEQARRPKIIALTADAMTGDREKCIDAGMDDYMSKPVRLEQLRAMITMYGAPNTKALFRSVETAEEEMMRQRLAEILHETDEQFLREMTDSFPAQSTASFDLLSAAWQNKKPSEIVFAAHKLRGLALNFGAAALAQQCRMIEQATDDAILGMDHAVLEKIQQEVHKAADMLSRIVTGVSRQS